MIDRTLKRLSLWWHGAPPDLEECDRRIRGEIVREYGYDPRDAFIDSILETRINPMIVQEGNWAAERLAISPTYHESEKHVRPQF